MKAFKPKKFVFLHCCANCEYGKKMFDVHGSALNYVCSKDPFSTRRLSGTHICDLDVDGVGEQISWFDILEDNNGHD